MPRTTLFQCLFLGMACTAPWAAHAQAPSTGIWRCGNGYTNQPDPGQNCQLLESSTITVIEGTRVQQNGAPVAATPRKPADVQVSTAEQQRRDARSRQILQAELDRLLVQQRSLRAQWAQADDAEKTRLRLPLERVEADVAAVKREMAP
mgnify:FL=1|jgi:hypothetical protein